MGEEVVYSPSNFLSHLPLLFSPRLLQPPNNHSTTLSPFPIHSDNLLAQSQQSYITFTFSSGHQFLNDHLME